MPEYDFYCKKCGKLSTYQLKMDEERPTKCEKVYNIVKGLINGPTEEWDFQGQVCNGPLVRVFDAPSVIYRAGGFNTTDKRLEPKESDLHD